MDAKTDGENKEVWKESVKENMAIASGFFVLYGCV